MEPLPSTLPGVSGVVARPAQPVQNGAPASAAALPAAALPAAALPAAALPAAALPAAALPAARTAGAFYTTRELQSLLHVDRTTIYRMADSGRLPGIKVGSQWRFPRRRVDQWLADQTGLLPAAVETAPVAAPPVAAPPVALWPTECLQILQETFADTLGVTILMTDLNGRLITQPSHSCGLMEAIEQSPQARDHCLQWWADLARRPSLQPSFLPSPAGILCTRGFFRRAHHLVGMVIVAGVAPANWPPAPDELERMAQWLGIAPAALQPHLHEVFHIDAAQEQRLLAVVQRIADVVTHILDERARLLEAPA